MHFREATIADIDDLFAVRMSVKENVLNTPELVTNDICADYLTKRGKGWLCEVDGVIVGFAIADLEDNSIWALFVRPKYEGQSIGRKLHDIMLQWYFSNTDKAVWLTTASGTRAQEFYKRSGWRETGITKSGEIRFEMDRHWFLYDV